ncbi:MAG: chemosensory pili system protein ChpB (putative protein-glutamate methylesterase) [Pseudohongiellaceae bacterium]|jgi:chemosensory pili system protein ChpB (putative protein-glutamate methylesterase)
MTTHSRRIAFVIDNDKARQALLALVLQTSHQLVANINVSAGADSLVEYLERYQDHNVDVWLVDTSLHHNNDVIDELFDRSEKHILVNEEMPSPQQLDAQRLWQKRLLEKLESFCVEIKSKDKRAVAADNVWVLAASLGGPEMVKRFMNALPKGLPISFVYVQHIAENFDKFLLNSAGGQQAYPLRLIETEEVLIEGATLVVPADAQLKFLHFGEVVKTHRPWEGQYKPSIDQVMCELAKLYRHNLGVIIFSGTCNDGEIGCRMVKSCGGTVWAQSPESCVSSAMPESAIATGCVCFEGDPEQLAEQLSKQMMT